MPIVHLRPASPSYLDPLRPAIDAIRGRRAWTRHLIYLRVREFYEETKLTRAQIVYPVPLYAREGTSAWPPNEIEPGPWHGPWPDGYQDTLITGLRWRHRGWRVQSHKPGRQRVSGCTEETPTAEGSRYTVWLDDWTSEKPPGRHLLASWGIVNEAASDYQHRFRLIAHLVSLHDRLLDEARNLLHNGAKLEATFAEASSLFAIPDTPDWVLAAPGQRSIAATTDRSAP